MSYLLDTHILLWAITDDPKLSKTARQIIIDENNVCYFSIASLWEITIKHSLGRLEMNIPLKDIFTTIINSGFTELNIAKEHLLELDRLEFHHRDPFDRLLVTQAVHENLIIITKDEFIPNYNIKTIW